MPEAGYIPIPRKLARKGVKDMVRISDGRMSGTAAGTIVLHVTPESALGGPLAAVRNGDRIQLSLAQRSISLLLPEAEIARRLATAAAERTSNPPATAQRGYLKLFLKSVTQADHGCDFDFLRAVELTRKSPAGRSS
jgi:dihydroxy-acid dehydratase